jgi:putative FmdB family regulatory protein
MPEYEYRCAACGAEFERYRSMAEYAEPTRCDCGAMAARAIITPPHVDRAFLGSTNMPGYKCIVTDEYVTSKKKRREILARTGLEEAAPLSYKLRAP